MQWNKKSQYWTNLRRRSFEYHQKDILQHQASKDLAKSERKSDHGFLATKKIPHQRNLNFDFSSQRLKFQESKIHTQVVNKLASKAKCTLKEKTT